MQGTEPSSETSVKTEAETGVVSLPPRNSMDCQQPPEPGDGRELTVPQALKERATLTTSRSQTSSLHERLCFCCFKPLSLCYPKKTIQCLSDNYSTDTFFNKKTGVIFLKSFFYCSHAYLLFAKLPPTTSLTSQAMECDKIHVWFQGLN